MAELQSGVLQGCCNAAVFLIGTGVSGGIIANGQLVRGTHFTAGEYSFVNTNADAWADESKNMACQCSTRALLEWYRARKGLPEDAPLDGRQFFDAVHAGEPEAQEVLDRQPRQGVGEHLVQGEGVLRRTEPGALRSPGYGGGHIRRVVGDIVKGEIGVRPMGQGIAGQLRVGETAPFGLPGPHALLNAEHPGGAGHQGDPPVAQGTVAELGRVCLAVQAHAVRHGDVHGPGAAADI